MLSLILQQSCLNTLPAIEKVSTAADEVGMASTALAAMGRQIHSSSSILPDLHLVHMAHLNTLTLVFHDQIFQPVVFCYTP